MSIKTSEKATKTAANSNDKNEPRYYTEGVIKDIWLESATDTRFSLVPDSECSIEVERNGEKKTCSVFRPEDFAEVVFGTRVANLYAGDFIFSVPKGMTLDQLLLIKVNACHLRIYVVSKDSLSDCVTGEDKPNSKSSIQASEIRVKQK